MRFNIQTHTHTYTYKCYMSVPLLLEWTREECKSNKINLTPSSICIRIQTTLTLQQIWHFSHTCQTQYNMCTLEYICAQKARLHAHTPIYDICAWEREQALQWNVIMLSYLSKKTAGIYHIVNATITKRTAVIMFLWANFYEYLLPP